MSHLTNVLVGRTLDGDSSAALLNFTKLTLTGAASSDTEAVRKLEFDSAVTNLQNQVTSIANDPSYKSTVYLDTTSADLATAVAAATYNNDGTFTFGSVIVGVGDILILNSATEQDSDRAWVHNGGTSGTASDFSAFGSDVDAAIQAVQSALLGDASVYTSLGLAEDAIQSIDTRVTSIESTIANHTEKRTFSFLSSEWVDNGDGTYTATVPHTYGTSEIMFMVQEDSGGGSWHYVASGLSLDVDVNSTQFVITTGSADVASHGYKIVCSAVPVV